MTTLNIIDGFDPSVFFNEHWQKKPLLIRNMFPNFEDPLSPEELAGLAMEEGTESRLVQGIDPTNWSVSHGPFTEDQFTTLPRDGWTLLVQAVDQWVESVYALRNQFQFLPSWRLEDLMVSFAAQGAGVGPHFDYYDVFIVQGLGSRNWKLGQFCDSQTKSANHAGLSLVDSFQCSDELTLSSGDVLYIPPQFSHWGQSNGRSLSYSVGCRAPSMAEMLEGFSDALIDKSQPDNRVRDCADAQYLNTGQIDLKSLTESFNKFIEEVDNEEEFRHWFGKKATLPKYPALIFEPETSYDRELLASELSDGFSVVRNPASRFSYIAPSAPGGKLSLYVDGRVYSVLSESEGLVQALCAAPSLNDYWQGSSQCDTETELIIELLNQGSLVSY